MECRLWGGCRLSGCGVDDMGKNLGGAKDSTGIKKLVLWRETMLDNIAQYLKQTLIY